MKAAVLYEPGKPLVLEDLDIDDPKENEIMIRLEAMGVCHSDLHFIKGDMPVPVPVVMGHEGCGIVEKVGPGVTEFSPRDKVITMVSFSCGTCHFCNQGRLTRCVEGMMIMMTAELPFFGGKRLRKGDQEYCQVFGLGSFAEKCVVHKRAAVKVRSDVPSEVACLLGCGVSTGIGAAIHTAGVRPGDTVAVFGCGGVGLSALMGAKLAGAGKLIAVDPAQNSLDMAKELGADILVNPGEIEDVPGKIKELTDGLGVDHAIEAAGSARVMETAFAAINNGGKCVVVGMASMEDLVTFFPAEFLLGKTITGTTQGDIVAQVDIPRFVDMHMNGKLPIDKLISRSYSLDQINEAFEALEKKEVLRSVIKM